MAAGDEHVDVAALALGEVTGQHRAASAVHVLACEGCRRQYDELTGVVSELLPAVPAVQPPVGFDEQVLHRLGVVPPRAGGRRLRRWLGGALAAAAVVVVLVVGLWWATRGEQVADEVAALRLTDGGAAVGTVSVSEVAGRSFMVVAIVDAPADVSYTCRAQLTDGRVVESAAWPAGAGAWIVPLPEDGAVTDVDLVVSGTDRVWSAASFAGT